MAWKYFTAVFNSWMFRIKIQTRRCVGLSLGEDLRQWESQIISPGCRGVIDVLVVHVVRPSSRCCSYHTADERTTCLLSPFSRPHMVCVFNASISRQRQSTNSASLPETAPSSPLSLFSFHHQPPIKHLYQGAHAPARYRANFPLRLSTVKSDGWRPGMKWSEVSIKRSSRFWKATRVIEGFRGLDGRTRRAWGQAGFTEPHSEVTELTVRMSA